MSSLKTRDRKLYEEVQKYPLLVQSLISFLTEPTVISLLEAGGQHQGSVTLNVVKGDVVSMVPSMEIKKGFEIPK